MAAMVRCWAPSSLVGPPGTITIASEPRIVTDGMSSDSSSSGVQVLGPGVAGKSDRSIHHSGTTRLLSTKDQPPARSC
jgi:hypothetical protein